MTGRKGIVAHTSGSTSVDVFEGPGNYGIFYPLQTFTTDREVDIKKVPFCIEASNDEVLKQLVEVAEKISNSVYLINSRQRKYLHVSAVLVNNFTNHLYQMASEFLEDRELDFKLLKPLILETANKIQQISPEEAQTGPARRGDVSTVNQQLEMLDGYPEYRQLYKLFSEQLMKKYHE